MGSFCLVALEAFIRVLTLALRESDPVQGAMRARPSASRRPFSTLTHRSPVSSRFDHIPLLQGFPTTFHPVSLSVT